ncbi:MAG: hypothetical protein AB1806_00630 [Acidobacteriota bacterium]
MLQPESVTPVIIREVPPKTPEVSVVDVLTGSLGLVGVIAVGAVLCGLIAGALYITVRRPPWKWRLGQDEDQPIRLDLSAPPR